jgi:MYXO-CTERM domain-containing protein
MTRPLRAFALAAPLALAALAAAPSASAFCGFYVAGSDTKLYNNATMVVLMREGTRTVLSMANNYQGPPESFAMVVPVPIVLQEENVKTLPAGIFDKVDKLASPRLVEYWEQDPCAPDMPTPNMAPMRRMAGPPGAAEKASSADDLGVTIEAQFTVGEYQIVILGAKDSLGLDTWLRQEKYSIPAGAEPLLRPYVAGGSKFFVAKVDAKKVKFENGMAQLSPLRFHYDTDTFALPVRLGMVNSNGTQDLLVHILARQQRFETANYKNVAIPTNLDVKNEVRQQFGGFYAKLFDRTLERHPGAAVTEYSWDAGTCDPCPGPTLTPSDLGTLGADVIDASAVVAAPPPGGGPMPPGGGRRMRPWRGGSGFVLTRLHLRYGKDALGEDLVFRAAPPIVGGREFLKDGTQLETGAVQSSVNNFQARYAIRHAWTGPVTCKSPRRGIWGGPPAGEQSKGTVAAPKTAFAPRGGVELVSLVARDSAETAIDSGPLVPATGMFGAGPFAAPPSAVASDPVLSGPPPAPPSGGCAGCRVGSTDADLAPRGLAVLGLLGAALAFLRRSRRRG